jgi:hypothetical protein
MAGLLGGLAASIVIGLCIYGVLSYLVKSQELKSILTEARRGIGKK